MLVVLRKKAAKFDNFQLTSSLDWLYVSLFQLHPVARLSPHLLFYPTFFLSTFTFEKISNIEQIAVISSQLVTREETLKSWLNERESPTV